MIIAPEAATDLRELFAYIATDNPVAAERLVNGLLAKMRWIADLGYTGQPRDTISSGLRSSVYRERCIFYRLMDDHVRVVRILHGRRDLDNQTFSENDS